MNEQFNIDQKSRPDLFQMVGSIPAHSLEAWLSKRNYVVPDDLRQFWSETGGGDIFESETILSPFVRGDLGDDVDSVNDFHRQKGMPANYLIFHTGIDLTAVRMPSGEYLSIREGSYDIQQTFQSLTDWYANLIRREYASRYGLDHNLSPDHETFPPSPVDPVVLSSFVPEATRLADQVRHTDAIGETEGQTNRASSSGMPAPTESARPTATPAVPGPVEPYTPLVPDDASPPDLG